MANSYSVSPYVGPRPFTAADTNGFYGRERQIGELVGLLVAHQAVLLYGLSGAGKTSLVRAGVIPTVRRKGQFLVLPVARVGGVVPPGLTVEQATNIYIFNLLASLGAVDTPQDDLRGLSLKEGLKPYLTDREAGAEEQEAGAGDLSLGPRNKPRLLIVDQFEEIFTSYLERYEDRADFFRQLGGCVSKYPELGLLISIREDYLAQLDSYAAHLPDRLRSRYRLERLDSEGALAAVRGPARAMGVSFAPGVAEALVDNLRRIRPDGMTPVLGQYVEPAHLQILCHRLWQQLPADRQTIEMEDLQAFGDVDSSLISWYDNALAKVADTTGVSERRLRDWFDEQLITPAGTRGLVFRGEADTAGLPNVVVDSLVRSNIIRADRRLGATWYELAHDRLVDPIRNANRLWGERHRRGLIGRVLHGV